MSTPAGFQSPSYRFDAAVVAFALLAGVFAPSEWLLYAFIVTGQAHFFLSCFYQYRGGKMTRSYLSFAAVLLFGVLAYLYFLGEQGVWMFLLVAFLFSAHFAIDEVTLHAEKMNIQKASTAVSFTALTFLIVLADSFSSVLISTLYQAAILLFACGVAARLLFTRASVGRSEYYVWAVQCVLLLMAFIGRAQDVLSVIILLHVFDWAIGYGRRLRGDPIRAQSYWRLTFFANAGAAIAALAFFLLNVTALRYFFLPLYYDAWASAHILLSLGIFGRRPLVAQGA